MVGNALKMGHGGGINGLRKPQRLRKMRTYEVATHNNKQLLTMCKQNTHCIGVYYSNISVLVYSYFWMIFQHKKIPSETWTHPLTSIVNTDFWGGNYLQSPLAGNLIPCTSYLVFTTQATGGCEV